MSVWPGYGFIEAGMTGAHTLVPVISWWIGVLLVAPIVLAYVRALVILWRRPGWVASLACIGVGLGVCAVAVGAGVLVYEL